MKVKSTLGIVAVVIAAGLLTASGAGAKQLRTTHAVDLSTNAAVKHYLQSKGISPKGVVIQRGVRNYAGPHCPGKGWTCTNSRRVVQIASTANVRAGTRMTTMALSHTNVAACVRLGGSNQSCVIVQSAGNGVSNNAQVDQAIAQSGQTLSGTQNAQVTQLSTGGTNTVQLNQVVLQLSLTLSRSVSQSQTSDQTFAVSQTSSTGVQTLKVNQVSGQAETAKFATTGTQFANGSLVGHITQASTGLSTATIKQLHNPSQSAQGPNVDQTVIDPFRCCATQSGNTGDTVNLTQNGTVQTTGDATPNISAVYEADCQSSGNCSVTETQNTNGTQSTNTSSGSTVSTSLNCTGSACTTGTITFDGSPGTAAPPATLGPYTMTPFGADPQALGSTVSGVIDPAGTLGFSPLLNHARIGQGWATWSNGYTGDVYSTTSSPITITLPPNTKAFYFYAEPNTFANFTIQATAQDGTTSGPISVQGLSGAQYYGFYETGGATLASISITNTDTSGFAVGEFGLAN